MDLCSRSTKEAIMHIKLLAHGQKYLGEMELKVSGKALLDDYKRLLFENNSLTDYISELSQAVGLITTLKPTMEMDADHPLDMAKEVEAYVTARITKLEATIDKLETKNCPACEGVGGILHLEESGI